MAEAELDADAPGTVRPGGRTARVRAEVLRAAEDVLIEHGFDKLDLIEIATRAGVGRTTVYRRWGTASALAADLLADMAARSVPRARTGTLRGDLRANAELVAATLGDARQGALFRALIAAATCHPSAAAALHGFYRARVTEWADCVHDAIRRGELSTGTDAPAVIRAVSAPLYYALLTTAEALDTAAAHRAADAAWAAARAGVFTPEG